MCWKILKIGRGKKSLNKTNSVTLKNVFSGVGLARNIVFLQKTVNVLAMFINRDLFLKLKGNC